MFIYLVPLGSDMETYLAENLAVTITKTALDNILENISTECAIYTDQVEYGVRITLDAIMNLVNERNFI